METRFGYNPPLDGVRALAVSLVVLGHASYSRIPGPYVGVEVFFVLSGFLITTLLLQEHGRNGRVRLSKFYVRRARRLLPALVACIALSGVLDLVDLSRPGSHSYGWAALGALFYSNNWLVAEGVISPASFLLHTWSLSVEEQFYLVWPIVLCLLLARSTGRRHLLAFTVVLSVLAAGWRPVLEAERGSSLRVVYGSDTRALGLLLGCTLAVAYADERWRHRVAHVTTPIAVPCLGLLFILFAWVRTTDAQALTLQIGLTLVDIASVLLIAHIVLGESLLHRIFGSRPMVWVGQRSYGIYLYHYPIVRYISGPHRLYYFGTVLSQEPIRLLAPLALAAVSYRFIEQPFRGHGRRPVTAPEPEPSV